MYIIYMEYIGILVTKHKAFRGVRCHVFLLKRRQKTAKIHLNLSLALRKRVDLQQNTQVNQRFNDER